MWWITWFSFFGICKCRCVSAKEKMGVCHSSRSLAVPNNFPWQFRRSDMFTFNLGNTRLAVLNVGKTCRGGNRLFSLKLSRNECED